MANLPVVTNDIKVALSKDGTTFVDLVEATTISNSPDSNVEEYDVIGSKYKRRIKTGGLTRDHSFEGKLVIDTTADSIYQLIKEVWLGDDLGNGWAIKLTYPHSSGDTSKVGEIHELTGVVKVTSFGGQSATDIAEMSFDFMSDNKPSVTAEEA